jgi:3-oxoadipate CoA-transferase beta subunit
MTGPLTMDQLAAVIASDIPPGSFVNLGIGHPTKVADHLPPEAGVVLHTENGMLGMGPEAQGEAIDPDLVNAGKVPVTERPGASYFHHADSFAMMTLLTRDGRPKLVPECTYPLTGLACVSRVYTDLAVFLIEPGRVVVRDLFGTDFGTLATVVEVPLVDGTLRAAS